MAECNFVETLGKNQIILNKEMDKGGLQQLILYTNNVKLFKNVLNAKLSFDVTINVKSSIKCIIAPAYQVYPLVNIILAIFPCKS